MNKRPLPPVFITYEISQTCWHCLHRSFQLMCRGAAVHWGTQGTVWPRALSDLGSHGGVGWPEASASHPTFTGLVCWLGAPGVKTRIAFSDAPWNSKQSWTPQAGLPLLLGDNIWKPAHHSITRWSTEHTYTATGLLKIRWKWKSEA